MARPATTEREENSDKFLLRVIPAFVVEQYNLFTRNILSRLDVVNKLKAFLFGFQGFVVNLLFYPHAQCQLIYFLVVSQ